MISVGLHRFCIRCSDYSLISSAAPRSLHVSPPSPADAGSAKTVDEGLFIPLQGSWRSLLPWDQAPRRAHLENTDQDLSDTHRVESSVDSKTHSVRRATDVLAPATTVKPLELVSGTISLLFQLFASCMTGKICESAKWTKLI